MNYTYIAHHGIKDQKWGVRRYQNPDGTLTDAGKKRYDRDVRENNAKKKDNRIIISEPDSTRWVQEDLTRTKDVVDSTSDAVENLQKLNASLKTSSSPASNADLSSLSDNELRALINRKLLENQYNNLYSTVQPSKVEKGREHVEQTLNIVGAALGVTASALSIAMAIQKLKG